MIPVAVQMSTLGEESEKDFPCTLKKVAELGIIKRSYHY